MVGAYEQARARSALAHGDREMARQHADVAFGLMPGDPVLANNLGALLASGGDYQASLDYYRRATALRPDYVEATYNLITTLMQVGRWDEAQAEYARSQQAGISLGAASSRIEGFLLEERTARQQLASMEEAARARPADASLLLRLAEVQAQLRHLGSAEESFRRALAVDPSLAPAYYGLGLILSEKSDTPGAMEAWRRYLEVAPDGAKAVEVRNRIREMAPPPELKPRS